MPQGLVKSFGLKMAVVIVMSAIIGSGVFKKVAPMADGLHSAWLVSLAWALAGVIVLFGVMSIAELGALYPDSGGPVSWLEKIYGKTVSYLYGWTAFSIQQTATIASVAFVFAGAVNTFIPLPHLSPELEAISIFGVIQPLSNIGAKFIAILAIVFLTIVNIRGAKKGGFVSMIFTTIIGLSIIAIAALAFSSSIGSWQTFNTTSAHYPKEGFGILGFFMVMVIAMRNAFWGFEGWLGLSFIGEELKNPSKTMPRALIIGIILISFLYLAINMGYLYVMPIDELVAKVNADENNIAAVVVTNKMFGNIGALIVSAMILVSTFGCTNGNILVSARIYYAMAKKGLFFKGAAKTDPKYHTPKNALIYQCIWTSVLVMSGSFDFLTDLLVIAGFTFYGLVVFGVILLRFKDKTPRPYKTIGYPVIPILFTVFCIVLLVVSLIQSPEKIIIDALLISIGLPFYFYWRKRSKTQSEPAIEAMRKEE